MTEQPSRPVPPVEAPPVYRYSRREAGVLAFGLRGRIVVTALLVGLPLAFFASAGAFGVLGIVIWLFFALPLLLRDVWRRTRVLAAPRRRVEWTPPPGEPPPPGTYVGPNHPGQPRW